MIDLFSLEFMRNSLIAALLVGASAPLVGVFLVQRGMSLIGDGMGHVALAGVGIGVLTGSSPVLTALIVVVLAAVAIELLRHWGRTGGDLALAVMFYGGIAAGVVTMAKAPQGSSTNLQGYLFGALNTVSRSDLIAFAVLAAVVLVTVLVLRERLFAVAQDEEYARASGLPVLATNILLAVLTGVTVVISMRVIGLLLISALMILPNATGQHLGRSFRGSLAWAVLVGLVTSAGGVVTSFYANTPSGATIVLLAITAFVLSAGGAGLVQALRHRRHRAAEAHEHVHWEECGHEVLLHGDHVDYLHDGHRHARHGDHWDEHDPDHPEPRSTLEGSQR
ncbi:metal ABC transporter permease [Janibacter sp. GS2]|uniref:metal ABC transporter permease n=1 Tax=Janibacter sp. GS2 TaxID=3442646 RepID=UPI003EBA4E71